MLQNSIYNTKYAPNSTTNSLNCRIRQPLQSPHIPPLPPFPSSQAFGHKPLAVPPIPLPPLTPNIHTSPPPIIASISLQDSQPQIKSSRKRNATQMMAAAETTLSTRARAHLYHNTDHMPNCKQSKRQKIQRAKKSLSPKPHKKGSTSSKLQTAKFKICVDKLKVFAVEHNHKLPSLRYIMKMLKVGFPKAHDIIAEYAKSIGKTKEQVVQDMTVRQENERKASYNKKGKKRKKNKIKQEKKCDDTDSTNSSVFSTHTPIANKDPKEPPKLIPENFSTNLTLLLDKVTDDENWQVFERGYLWNVSKLESFLECCNDYIFCLCDLDDKVKYATACYVLSEAYYRREWNQDKALSYFEAALSAFKRCNIEVGEDIHGGLIGYFWKEIVSVLILGGEILLEANAFIASQKQYDAAYNIVMRIDTNDSESKNDCLYQCLQHLSVIHCYQRNYRECCKYGKEFLNQQESSNISDIRGLIETKAWLSCNLMYCDGMRDREEGYKYYKDVLRDSHNKLGRNHELTYRMYCYFAIQFIRNYQWIEAHKLMYKILAIENNNELSDKCKEDIHSVFVDYIEYIGKLSSSDKSVFIVKFRQEINCIIQKLHYQHIKYINDINKSSMIKQNEYKQKNIKRARERVGQIDDDDDDDEDIDIVLNDRFNYNVTSEYDCLYPKINIIGVLIGHISLLLTIGNEHFGYHILNALINKQTKCLNQNSLYLNSYPLHKIKVNEINALLNLL